MNYYPFHVGDYAAHTAHLEPMEDLAYRRMLDAYYLREEPLPAEPADVARLIRMRQNMAEVEAFLASGGRITVVTTAQPEPKKQDKRMTVKKGWKNANDVFNGQEEL